MIDTQNKSAKNQSVTVPVNLRNFITCPQEHSLLTLSNEGNVTLNYQQAMLEKTTSHLSKEVKAIWHMVRDLSTGKINSVGTDLLAN